MATNKFENAIGTIKDLIALLKSYKGKPVSEQELIKIIYKNYTKPKNNASCVKQVKRYIKKINERFPQYIVVYKKSAYTLSEIKKLKEIKDSKKSMQLIDAYIKDKKIRVIDIKDYSSKSKGINNYFKIIPIELIKNEIDNDPYFLAYIIKEKNIIGSIIKRFYFSRIGSIEKNPTDQIENLKTDKKELIIKSTLRKNFKALERDDFGYIIQGKYELKKVTISFTNYFEKIILRDFPALYKLKKIDKIKGKRPNAKNLEFKTIAINYIDIQRVVQLILVYLNHIKIVEEASDPAFFIDFEKYVKENILARLDCYSSNK
ncbi:MAG: hypothetical protein NTY72_15050 [Bacteroidetes bacterium]|nr:hypothetical protein [Bacteroidota bacterium]